MVKGRQILILKSNAQFSTTTNRMEEKPFYTKTIGKVTSGAHIASNVILSPLLALINSTLE